MAVKMGKNPITIELDDEKKQQVVLRPIQYGNINAFEPAGRGYFYLGDQSRGIGLVDWQGRVILEPVFDRISPYYDDGVIIGVQGKTSVLFNLKGETLTKQPVDTLLRAGRGVTILNSLGTVIHADAVGDFSEGLAVVKIGDRCSYINAQGYLTMETGRPFCREFRCERAMFCDEKKVGFFRTKKTWGYINRRGKTVIEAKYDAVRPFSEGRAAVLDGNEWRYINKVGSPLACFRMQNGQQKPIKPIHIAEDFINGYACVMHAGKSGVRMLADGSYTTYTDGEGGWGLLHESGELTIPMEYERIGEVNEYGICLYTNSTQKTKTWGLMSARGEKRTPEKFVGGRYLSDGCFALVDAAGNQWAAGRGGRIIGQRAWDEIGSLVSEGISVRRGEKWGMIDFEGREIVPFEYDDAFCFCSGHAFVQRSRKGEIISKDGTVLASMDIHVSIPLCIGLSLVSYDNALWLLDYGYSPEKDDAHKHREREKRMRE